MEKITTEYASNLCRTIEASKDLNPIYLLADEQPLVSKDTNLGHFDPRLFIRKSWLSEKAYDTSRFRAGSIDQLEVSSKLEITILKNYINDVDLSKKGRSIKYNKNIVGVNVDPNYINCDYDKYDLTKNIVFDNTCWLNPIFMNSLGMKRRRAYMPRGVQLIIESNYDISQLLCLTYTSNEYLNKEGLLIKYKTILQDVACDALYLKYFKSKADALQSAENVLDEAECLGLNREEMKKYFEQEHLKFIEWSWEDFD